MKMTSFQGGKCMKYLVLFGRLFYTAIFIMAGPAHFTQADIAYGASQGVPLASIVVPLSGLIALLGGLSILAGYQARYGAWLLVLFLVPVTVMMHNFWTITEPMAKTMQQIMFMKNLSMLGAAMLIVYFGSGPLSMDNKTL
jgi:putative oxidoreductase